MLMSLVESFKLAYMRTRPIRSLWSLRRGGLSVCPVCAPPARNQTESGGTGWDETGLRTRGKSRR